MYSVQHVLWRGAMALSLLVVGGVGAGVSVPQEEQVKIDLEECQEVAAPEGAADIGTYRHVDLGTIVIVANAKAVADEA